MGQIGDSAVAMRLWWRYDAKCFHNVKRKGRYHRRRSSVKQYAQGQAAKLKHPAECEKCEQIVKTHAHHWDYKRPLDVVFLCHTCHMRVHACLRYVGTPSYRQRVYGSRQELTHSMTPYDSAELGELW
jgi:hypothetical protein